MGRKKKKITKPWCWEFEDDKILLQHQKAKHFKCHICHKKLFTGPGLQIHCMQVHKENIEKVPNSIKGRDDITLEICGMENIPEQDLIEHEKQKLNSKYKNGFEDSDSEGVGSQDDSSQPPLPPQPPPPPLPPSSSSSKIGPPLPPLPPSQPPLPPSPLLAPLPHLPPPPPLPSSAVAASAAPTGPSQTSVAAATPLLNMNMMMMHQQSPLMNPHQMAAMMGMNPMMMMMNPMMMMAPGMPGMAAPPPPPLPGSSSSSSSLPTQHPPLPPQPPMPLMPPGVSSNYPPPPPSSSSSAIADSSQSQTGSGGGGEPTSKIIHPEGDLSLEEFRASFHKYKYTTPQYSSPAVPRGNPALPPPPLMPMAAANGGANGLYGAPSHQASHQQQQQQQQQWSNYSNSNIRY